MLKSNLEKTFCDLLQMTREHDPAPDMAHGLKLSEECGEVSEAILKGNGYMPHKELKEDVMHEVADVMNTCCALLTSHYPVMSPESIAASLNRAMVLKGQKYAGVLGTEFGKQSVGLLQHHNELQGILDNITDAVADLEGDETANAFDTLTKILRDYGQDTA